MYADFSQEKVNGFLSELTQQPVAPALNRMAEDFSDDMILAQMELTRYKAAVAAGDQFVPRSNALAARARIHPADML